MRVKQILHAFLKNEIKKICLSVDTFISISVMVLYLVVFYFVISLECDNDNSAIIFLAMKIATEAGMALNTNKQTLECVLLPIVTCD